MLESGFVSADILKVTMSILIVTVQGVPTLVVITVSRRISR
jgi:hypothetical protein